MRKPAFCICEDKGTDQLRSSSSCAADQRLCCRYIYITIPLHSKPISIIGMGYVILLWHSLSLPYIYSVAVQPGFRQTRSETPKTDFLATRLHCTAKYTWIGDEGSFTVEEFFKR